MEYRIEPAEIEYEPRLRVALRIVGCGGLVGWVYKIEAVCPQTVASIICRQWNATIESSQQLLTEVATPRAPG